LRLNNQLSTRIWLSALVVVVAVVAVVVPISHILQKLLRQSENIYQISI
jgi:hypothetical protein